MAQLAESAHGGAQAGTLPRAGAPESLGETLTRLRYRWWPDHWLGEILAKRWTETAIPVLLLLIVVLASGRLVGNFYSQVVLADTLRQAGEIGLVVLGLALVMIVGGIDLSVGSMFALTNFCALMMMHVWQWPVAVVIACTLLCGAGLGAINGVLVGYLRLRAFLTTLITLIIFRAVYELLSLEYSTQIAGNLPDSAAWDFLGNGTFLGLPTVAWVIAGVAIFGHVMLTRLRIGWHIMAIGGSRRSAYNGGIAVRRTIALCYVAGGMLTAMAGCFFASRLATAGADIGVGMEVLVLTAAVIGGISLGGGRGSVTKALVGTLIVLLITNGLTSLSAPGGLNRMVLASILIIAAVIDVRWLKNRQRIISKVYVSPAYQVLGKAPECTPGNGTVWAVNDKLHDVTLIGEGRIEAPEDVILDRDDHLYAGSRHGDIMRFFAPDYQRMEVFAHIGGQPLGLAFDRDDNLLVCIGGMGLYRVTPERVVQRVSDETNRSLHSINDDSRLRLADDLDIADDGRVFFSEATTRYEMHEWPVDGLEARGNGRIVCYDPRDGSTRTVLRNLRFPNGVCIASDGQSILFAETWGACIKRYWFDGPKTGQVQTVVDSLPGYPDNINLASDGNYWLALVGMRCPAYDLALRMPAFRKRMAKRVPVDEWLFPNINTGCVLKFNEAGEVLETLWDPTGKNHPMITSMREHRGHLYLGGILNNRIGRYKLPGADPNFVQYERRWRGGA
jgi:ribose transport system permease protein